MIKLSPQGNRVLVEPLATENYVNEKGIEFVDNDNQQVKVVEYAPIFEGLYAKGDILLVPKTMGSSQQYNGKLHLWLDGRGYTDGAVIAIISKVKQGTDKGDNL